LDGARSAWQPGRFADALQAPGRVGTLRAVAALNHGLRFLLELGGVVSLAYWGWRTGETLPLRLVLAIGVPLALAVAWSLIVAPGDANAIPQTARTLLGTAFLLVSATALAVAGQPQLAAILALLIDVNQVVPLVPGGTEA
jgi:hypothetical protein